MKMKSRESETGKACARLPWWRRPDAQIGVAAILWLGSILAAVAVEAWPVMVLLIVLGVVVVRVLQVLAYRD